MIIWKRKLSGEEWIAHGYYKTHPPKNEVARLELAGWEIQVTPSSSDKPNTCIRDKELPDDYEPCGECGFDHSYEQNEAVRAHRQFETVS